MRCGRSRRRWRTTIRIPRTRRRRRSIRKAVRLTAQVGSIVATWGRLQAGGGPIAPDPAMGHAANFLYMLTGERPNATAIRAFDVALILHADHELNASTFAGRVAAATLTDIYSAIVAAIGTLKGPLHGGANAEVMKMLLELGRDRDRRARGRRHSRQAGAQGKDLRVRPPRLQDRRPARHAPAADVARSRQAIGQHGLVRHVAAHRGAGQGREEAEPERGLLLGVHLLRARHPDRSLHADLCRQPMSGWTAHILEQYANNRLIRPRADYTGPSYPQRFAPLDQR